MKPSNLEKKHITSFIKQLGKQDYAGANKSLEKVIHEKIRKKIALAAKKPLFFFFVPKTKNSKRC